MDMIFKSKCTDPYAPLNLDKPFNAMIRSKILCFIKIVMIVQFIQLRLWDDR